MIYLNRIEIMGFLGKDAETFVSQSSGKKVVKMSVATTRRGRKNANGETQDVTQWHSVEAWGSTAEIIDRMRVTKGTPVYVAGEIAYKKWTDKNGVNHVSTSIVASSIQVLKVAPAQYPDDNEDYMPF